jgi:hypothetical protein
VGTLVVLVVLVLVLVVVVVVAAAAPAAAAAVLLLAAAEAAAVMVVVLLLLLMIVVVVMLIVMVGAVAGTASPTDWKLLPRDYAGPVPDVGTLAKLKVKDLEDLLKQRGVRTRASTRKPLAHVVRKDAYRATAVVVALVIASSVR